MTGRTILVVDDDLRTILVEQLQMHEEFHILHENNAVKAIETALRENIDLIVMDIGLPDLDGREAVKILRQGGEGVSLLLC